MDLSYTVRPNGIKSTNLHLNIIEILVLYLHRKETYATYTCFGTKEEFYRD